jgi:hypothetical protein
MPSAAKHPEEARRLGALHALKILDSESKERFARITRLAQRLFDTQMSRSRSSTPTVSGSSRRLVWASAKMA